MAGGVVGGAAREALAQALPGHLFPIATLVANLSGAFVLGLLLEALAWAGEDHGRRRRLRLLAGTGFCGAYTTYSTFAVESVQLAHHRHPGLALVYVAATVAGGLVTVWAGIAVGAGLHRPTTNMPVDPDTDAP